MASIETRRSKGGAVTYRAIVRKRGKYASETFPSKIEAVVWAEKIEKMILAGKEYRKDEPQLSTPVAELFNIYKQDQLPHLKDAEHSKQRLGWWEKELEGLSIGDVTPRLVSDRKRKLSAQLTPATVNRYLAALSSVFSFALKDLHWVTENPVCRVSRLSEPKGRVRYLTKDEMDRLLKATSASESYDLHTAVLVALTTGARRSEVFGLRWGQIDFEKRRITLLDGETKNDEGRTLPLVAPVAELLAERKRVSSHRTGTREFVFRSGDVRRSWENALVKAGIDDFRWHDLRHTAASYLMMMGVSPLEISKILGHKTMTMVSRYAHLAPDRVTEIGDDLVGALGLGTKNEV